MKLAVSNLKGIDYKQLLIEHGEKFVIAGIALFTALALWGTNWKTIDKTPEELSRLAGAAKEDIEKQAWPESEKTTLNGETDLPKKIDRLLSPVDTSRFAWSIPMNQPLHPEKKPISKPRWLAVDDLVADAGVANIEVGPDVKPLNEEFIRPKPPKDPDMGKNADKDKSKGPDKKAEEEPLPEDFRPKERLANDPTKKHNIKRIEKAEERRERRDGPRGKPNAAKDAGTGEASATTTAAAAKYGRRKFNGRGYRFVAVRGVFPLRAQVQELSRAIGETTMTLKDIQELVQFQDFRLERQTARPGADPWSGPWETVEREPAIELLTNEANNLAPETVADGIVDSHICMPYPDRLVGEWATLATHPQIRDFVLSSEEVEEQMNYERRVLDRMKDAEDKKKEAAQSGGFTGVSRNMRDLQRRATQSTATVKSVQQELLEEIKKNKGDVDQAEINERLKKYITDRSNAIDHLLLFRYLDTTVEQGKTYRYRVKLVLENPFSQRHLEEVADPSIIEGATRETDYSEPTKPIHVPEDARFFVKAVDGRAGGPSLPLASLDVYQWFASTGTVVNKVIRAQIGQLVGGKERAQVLRPSDQTFDVESVPFATGKALVDVAPGASLDSNLHADILGELSTNAKRSSGAVPDEAVVVDENGTLFVLDDLEQAADHARARKRYEFQIRPFEDLRKSESKDDDGIKRLEGMSKHNKAGGLTKSAKGKHSADPRRKPKAFRKDKRQ